MEALDHETLAGRTVVLAHQERSLGVEHVLKVGEPGPVLGQNELEGALSGVHRVG